MLENQPGTGSFELAGVGSVDLRTNTNGKIRVVVEGEDVEALHELWERMKERM